MSKDNLTLRNVLKTTALGVAALASVPTMVSARELSREEMLNKGHRIKSQQGMEACKDYLEERGVTVKTSTFSVPLDGSSDSSDGVQTRSRNKKADLETGIIASWGPDEWIVDGFFEWAVNDVAHDGYRDDQKDWMTIEWPKNSFNLNDVHRGSYNYDSSKIWLKQYKGNRYAMWGFDDSETGPGAMYDGYVRAYLANYSNDGDRVYYKYYHTWGMADFIGISYGSQIKLGFSDGSDKWVSDPEFVEA